ncbi:MAG: glycoside hydrolase family 38 C-terminal domain-containing protein [Gemmatimonadota bacterium]
MIAGLLVILAAGQLAAQARAQETSPDLTRESTLFVVGYAHLDTQWRWDFETTIREYLPKTLRENFALFEKYPNYVFNFSGANRYRMIREYYPTEYEKLKEYVAAGRWFPSGSSMEENDVNAPSAESVFRQILYGTQFFRAEFGKTSQEYMLPDCFGFPASLPSILAHAGIKGFSTQKLSSSWQPAARVGGPDSPQQTPEGIPFNVGIWEGTDGATVLAALNPGSYSGSVTYDLSKAPPPPPPSDTTNSRRRNRPLTDWPARIDWNGQSSGLFTDYMYYGTGDTGGSPTEASVRLMEAMVTGGETVLPDPWARRGSPPPSASGREVPVGDGSVKVVSATAEEMFQAIPADQTSRLPRYKGELELINHSAGSITSQAYVKRWNRQNEVLADGAERASVMAQWLGGLQYPLHRLNGAWTLVMTGQFHDIIPGTSIPKAYEYSWNDEILALNQFAGVLTHAVGSVGSVLDTNVRGSAVVVYNALDIPRQDVVEAKLSFQGGLPTGVIVVGPDGRRVPAQLTDEGSVLFLASVPSVGAVVYDVRPEAAPDEGPPELSVNESSLENHRYRVELNSAGDIASVFDKKLERELLAAPARLEIKTDNPSAWPAWNMDWEDQIREPRAYVGGPARVTITEGGPVRVALTIERETEGSRFVQTVRLAAGDAGNRIEIGNLVDWNTREAHLKAVFPLTAENASATYNLDVGTIERGNNDERQFEVASHQWFDLTDRGGEFGVTVLSDAKLGSDKPDEGTLRLTLIRTPGTRGGYEDQGTQDIGRHEFEYGLAAHASGWREARTDWQAQRLNQPLIAFESSKHEGELGRSFSFLRINDDRVRVLALKRAEETDEYVVRIVELAGEPARDVHLTFATNVAAAREINAAETPAGPAEVRDGELVTELGPYQPRTFAVRLDPPSVQATPPRTRVVSLPYDQAVASIDGSVASGRFDRSGRSLPAEMLPERVEFGGVPFDLAPATQLNAVTPLGQTLQLPAGAWNRVYLLAAADGDQTEVFQVGDSTVELTIQDWGGYIGQWENRIWSTREELVPPRAGSPPNTPPRVRTVSEVAGLAPGYIKSAPVAWFASHRHGTDGTNEPYQYSYLFAHAIDMPPGTRTLTLPVNEGIRILAVTVTEEASRVMPAHPLYDTLDRAAYTPPDFSEGG